MNSGASNGRVLSDPFTVVASSTSVSQLASQTSSGITFSLTQSDACNESSHIIITGQGGENQNSFSMTSLVCVSIDAWTALYF